MSFKDVKWPERDIIKCQSSYKLNFHSCAYKIDKPDFCFKQTNIFFFIYCVYVSVKTIKFNYFRISADDGNG